MRSTFFTVDPPHIKAGYGPDLSQYYFSKVKQINTGCYNVDRLKKFRKYDFLSEEGNIVSKHDIVRFAQLVYTVQ